MTAPALTLLRRYLREAQTYWITVSMAPPRQAPAYFVADVDRALTLTEKDLANGAAQSELEAENARLASAVRWALGEEGEFAGEEPEPLAGKYRRRFWWRSELRERAFGPASPKSPLP